MSDSEESRNGPPAGRCERLLRGLGVDSLRGSAILEKASAQKQQKGVKLLPLAAARGELVPPAVFTSRSPPTGALCRRRPSMTIGCNRPITELRESTRALLKADSQNNLLVKLEVTNLYEAQCPFREGK